MLVRKLFTCSIVLGACACAQSEVIFYDGFETPNLGGGYTFTNSAGPWKSDGEPFEIGDGHLYGVIGWVDNQVLELDAIHNSAPYVELHTAPSVFYRVSFLAAQRDTSTPEDNTFEVLWDDQVVFALTPTSNLMNTYGFTLVASNSLSKLTFRGAGIDDGVGGIIANVRVERLGPVPEPSSMAALAGGLLLWKRRRFRTTR